MLLFLKRVKAALAVSLISLAIAFTSFLAIGKDLEVWKSDVYHQVIGGLLPGCFLWMASLAVVPLACWLKITNKSGDGESPRVVGNPPVTQSGNDAVGRRGVGEKPCEGFAPTAAA